MLSMIHSNFNITKESINYKRNEEIHNKTKSSVYSEGGRYAKKHCHIHNKTSKGKFPENQ